MPIYQNSIIYKLCHCNDLENKNIYVGSTTNFRNRKYLHKNRCNNKKNKKYNFTVYKFIRDNDGWDNWVMIPIEVYPCNDKKELEVRERHHIELLKPKLNKVIPTRTQKEWYQDNKEKILEKTKQYQENNKEQIEERSKKYRDNNKEKIKEKDKKYREANKEKINEKHKEKVICDNCNAEVTKGNLNTHKKSNKCKNYNITK